MILNRPYIFKKYQWLKNKKNKFIISADFDGLICASFLHHYLNWELVGYYNMENIWISKEGLKHKRDLVWVDLNIVPKQGKAIGGHITIYNDEIPRGLDSSCNPNLLMGLSQKDFRKKFPFSTIIFLLWLFNKKIPFNEIAKLLVLHSDSSWMKIQKYPSNINNWIKILNDYDVMWNYLTTCETVDFEKTIDQHFYPLLSMHGAHTGFSKLKSKHLKIQSRECILNPDWDEDVILNLFDLFAQYLFWDPPLIPSITSVIKGEKYSIPLDSINKTGLNQFIKDNKVFSYAITSPKTFKYTVFNTIK